MAGTAGEYYSVTWPGFVGMLTAMAPGRFAAASTRRRCGAARGIRGCGPYDIAVNAIATWPLRHMPPDQLLRQVFETCAEFRRGANAA